MDLHGSNTRGEVLTIDHSEVDSELADFPYCVDLSEVHSDLHSAARTDFRDVRCYDASGNLLYSYVTEYDSSAKTGTMYVCITISDLTDTTIQIEVGSGTQYDNDPETFTESGYVRWYDLDESSGTTLADACDNASATTQNTVTVGADGHIDKAINMAGAGYARASSPGLDTWSVEAWCRIASSGWYGAVTWYGTSGQARGLALSINNNVFGYYGTKYQIASTTTMSNNTWYRIAGKGDTSSMDLFVNDTKQSLGAASNAAAATADYLHLGTTPFSPDSYEMNGRLDTVAVSSVKRSDDWIEYGYSNQSNPANTGSLSGVVIAAGEESKPRQRKSVVLSIGIGL